VILRRSGPYASLLELDADPGPDAAQAVADLRDRLEAVAPPEVRELVPGERSVLVEHRPTLHARALRAWLARAERATPPSREPVRRTVSVAYGEGADVDELEAALGLGFDEIARLHAGHEATVTFLGYAPGFPYLAGLPAELRAPRRERPRGRLPAGSVTIGADRGGLYPTAAPGAGWVLGRTDAPLFDPYRDPPAWLGPGDRVRFRSVAPEALARTAAPPRGPLDADGPGLRVEGVAAASASLQGGARFGGGSLGLAQAGALDPLAREAGNRMLGNEPDAPVLELVAPPLVLASEAPLRAAVAGGGVQAVLDGRPLATWRAFAWPAGSVVELRPDPDASGRTAVLAVQGGFVSEVWRGSPSTDLRSAAGGSRRWLAAGDRLVLAGAAPRSAIPHPGRPRYARRVALRLHAGPDPDPVAFEELTRRAFRLAGADRASALLDGAPVPVPTVERSVAGVPWGAVQITPGGAATVLLSDRSRTGAYPVPAVVDPRDLWRLAQTRPGDEVWLLDARGATRAHEPLDFGS
jgi:KipI family sensor histidine kinase inhibitor